MPDLDPADYEDTSITPRFTFDGCVIQYKNISATDRDRIFREAQEHAVAYRDHFNLNAEFRQKGEDATLTVGFRSRRRTGAQFEIFKGMIMATLVKTSWGGR